MSMQANEEVRTTFAGIADVLIPEAEGMPSATQVGVRDETMDRLLGLRPDLREAFMRGIRKAMGQDPREAAEALNKNDPEALTAIGLIASAGYYMSDRVRELIGYPGQEKRPGNPDEEPEYVTNGMLQEVIDRGPIYVPTPK
jgi:hypothetical protein